jgi:hypothetical protein
VLVKKKMPDGRMYWPSFLWTWTGILKRTLHETFPPPLQLMKSIASWRAAQRPAELCIRCLGGCPSESWMSAACEKPP